MKERKSNLNRLNKTKQAIKRLPAEKRELADALFKKAEFMNGELEKLQAILQEKGWVEEYQNGANQYGLKKSSEGDVYNTMIKNFNSTIKALNEMLPDDAESDELEKWLNQ